MVPYGLNKQEEMEEKKEEQKAENNKPFTARLI